MKIGLFVTAVAALALGAFDAPARVRAAEPMACDALTRVPIANGTVLSAESVPAGGFKAPGSTNASAAAMSAELS